VNLFGDDRDRGLPGERRLAAEQLVHQQAERVDVAACVGGPSFGLLRAQIGWRAEDLSGRGVSAAPPPELAAVRQVFGVPRRAVAGNVC